jgi:molybdopterin/thiamine biosynthesis adenylyltransferase
VGDSLSDKFSRQRGLVNQDRLENLRVSYCEHNVPPPEFIDAMALLAQQLGVKGFPCVSKNSDFMMSWANSSNNSEKLTDLSVIEVAYGGEGVFLDGTPSETPSSALFEPALATLAACLAWSEILRRSDCYTPVDVPKVSVSVNIRVNETSMRGSVQDLEFGLDGIDSFMNIRPVKDGTAHKRVSLRLDEKTLLVQELLNKLRITGGEKNTQPKHPVMHFSLPTPRSIPSGHLTVVGAGGLGTWALHSIVNGLKNSEHSDLEILVFDKDMKVEKHNLNRQVIFSDSDIGRPKVEAAKDWLNRNLPSANISLAYELHDGILMKEQSEIVIEDEEGLSLEQLLIESSELIQSKYEALNDDEVRRQLASTDVILGCLDAMRPRVLADLIAARKGQCYVNGGVNGLFGQYTEFSSTNLVNLYGPSVARDRAVYSCQEDGEVPLSSLAITNAFVGSLQAISALQHLTGMKCASIGSVNWDARSNEVFCNLSDGNLNRKVDVKRIEDALWKPMTSDIILEDSPLKEA